MIMLKWALCFRVPIAFSHAERELVGSLDDGATVKFLDAAIIMTRKRKMMKPPFFLFATIMPFLFHVEFEGHLKALAKEKP